MAIKRVTEEEFNSFNPMRHPMMANIASEMSWFSDDAENVIGTVLLDRADNDWNWVAMGRDERGRFRALAVQASLADQATAEAELIAKLTEYEATGESVFPQGD